MIDWVSEIRDKPLLDTRQYDFPAISPGGTLTGGVLATITFSPSMPCPLGVNGNDVSHYLYIPAGSGAAEAILISGGTAVAGGISGTLTFTPANNHSAGWKLESATGGGAEAHQAVVTAGNKGIVQFMAAVQFHQGIYASSSSDRTTFTGLGNVTLLVSRATDYISGDLFHNDAGASWTMQNLGISQSTGGTTSGAGVYIGPGQISMDHVAIFNGQFGVRLVGAVSSSLNDVSCVNTDMTFKAAAGLSLENLCDNIFVSNSQFVGAPTSNPNVMLNGIRILSVDGLFIDNTNVSADSGISFSPSGNYIANVKVNGIQVDTVRDLGVVFTGAAFPINNVRFTGGHIHNQSDGSTIGLGPAVYFDPTATAIDEISFTGMLIAGSAVENVQVLNPGAVMKNLNFNGCSVSDGNRSNSAGLAGIKLANGTSGFHLVGSVVGNTLGGGHQKYAVSALGALANSVISGNDFTQNETAAMNSSIIPSGWSLVTMLNNDGVDNVPETIVAATSISLSYYPYYTVTGTTAIATILGGWTGRVIILQFTNGSPGGVTTGGNIYTAKAAVQNASISLRWDGAGWLVL
jgi:hypothetical protein